MLIEFSVGNFRSFNAPVTFSMVAANITAKNKALDEDNVFQLKNVKLLKSAAIYGANASGKSNLIAAFAFMRKFVLESTESNSEDQIPVQPFLLNTGSLNQPSYFEVIFQIKETRYRYGFEVSTSKVQTEWLYQTKIRESELFWRAEGKIEIKSGFKEGRGLEERTRENALFISVSDQWNGEIAHKIIQWFKAANIISGLEDIAYLGFTVQEFVENDLVKNKIREYMRQMDLGVVEISAEKLPVLPKEFRVILENLDEKKLPAKLREALSDEREWFTPSVKFLHQQFDESNNKVQNVAFSFEDQESEGTKKAFALSGPLFDTLSEGKILFVDELDARLHPLMTKYIVKLFNSKVTNPNNAQLIFVTHDTNLLKNDFFRRDQIWFTEKDRFGSTDLYSLVEYKKTNGVRNDASFGDDYIAGKYGAIPFIGDISVLIGEDNGKA